MSGLTCLGLSINEDVVVLFEDSGSVIELTLGLLEIILGLSDILKSIIDVSCGKLDNFVSHFKDFMGFGLSYIGS